MTLETEARTANIGLAIWRLTCFYETFVQSSTAVILLNFRASKSTPISGNITETSYARTEKYY